LCLVAGLTSEADYVFIPEWPPERDWPAKLCRKLLQARNFGPDSSVFVNACREHRPAVGIGFFVSVTECNRPCADGHRNDNDAGKKIAL
jgi:hypothetical protein